MTRKGADCVGLTASTISALFSFPGAGILIARLDEAHELLAAGFSRKHVERVTGINRAYLEEQTPARRRRLAEDALSDRLGKSRTAQAYNSLMTSLRFRPSGILWQERGLVAATD